MKSRISFLLILFIAHPLAASLAPNLMRCTDHGLFQSDCRLDRHTLFAETKSEREFLVRYRYICDGHPLNLGFQTDKGFHSIRSVRGPQQVILQGRSLALIDRDPDATKGATFDAACVVQILKSSFTLSPASRDRLRMIREESQLITHASSIFTQVSKTSTSILNSILKTDFHGFVWQRDQLRKMVDRVDTGVLSRQLRIAFAANLRMLDQMAAEPRTIDTSLLSETFRKIVSDMLQSISEQQVMFLNRLDELRLQALEILIEAGEDESEEFRELYRD